MSIPKTKTNRLNRAYYRSGLDHRASSDVSFVDIRRAFGFRSIQVGKWVTQKEQQIAANLIFDALSDLAMILQIPKEAISLRGSLSLAFGTGGQKFAQAHYHIGKKELALAKNAGGGALAHEWFHAFDHYICSKMLSLPKSKFASHAWLLSEETMQHELNLLLSQVYQCIFLQKDNSQIPSEYFKTAALIDKKLEQVYYALPEELAARAFEAYIQDHSVSNEFLVKGTKQSDEAKAGLYPLNQHRLDIATAFAQYFELLGRYLFAETAR